VRIDAYASEPHYADHVRPVFDALGDMQGKWDRYGTGPVIVASYKDMMLVGRRPVIFMEHGAGQTYGRGHPSYAGGRDRERVVLFLCQSERVAALNRAAWPHVPSVVVGCPRLDALTQTKPVPGVVGFAWHFNALVCPESRSALPHYRNGLAEIAHRWPTVGTAHPRIAGHAEKIYADAGIEWVDDIFGRAEVLVVDNSSIGWEWLTLDRPVVWCNAPWYRKEVHFPPRFWDLADSGVQVNEPEDLAAAITVAFEDGPEQQQRRHAAQVYAHVGTATQHAVAAIVENFGG
jgi:hypothetical protein